MRRQQRRAALCRYYSAGGATLAVPIEPTVETRQNEQEYLEAPDLRRTLLMIDVAAGRAAGEMTYNGFCRALAELPEEDLLIVGLGRGWVQVENGRFLQPSPDDALLIFPVAGGEAVDARRAPSADLGVADLSVERHSVLTGCRGL